jgi:Tol biopolymer transport system component/DNA-binding winged helix-turn-helix (wHTH) protein
LALIYGRDKKRGGVVTFQFGVFELDIDKRELRKNGLRVKLHDQPFRVLALLIERQGEIVSRDELRTALWPADTFVEFDHSLNTAINKIRDALGDSAATPRFIETVPRRGYRFVAPVKNLKSEVPEVRHGRHWKWKRISIALGSVVAVVAVVLIFRPGTPAGQPVPVPLTAYPGVEANPTFSPDGNFVAFSWTGGDSGISHVYTKQIGTEQPVRLTGAPLPDYAPAWSPDGRWIVFVRGWEQEKGAIFIIPAVGGVERKIANISYSQSPLSWHPDSKSLIISDQDATGRFALYWMGIDAGEKQKLTFPTILRGDLAPAVSPDGRQVAFTRGSMLKRELYLLALSREPVRGQGEPVRLTSHNRQTLGAAWMPNGQEIVYSSGSQAIRTLWRVSTRGNRQPERLLYAGEGANDPTVSARGSRLAFTRFKADINIWSLRLPVAGYSGPPQTSTPTTKLIASTYLDLMPQFSPAGDKIAFVSDRSGSQQVWMCDREGSNSVQLTSLETEATNPSWSPDGENIAFEASLGGRASIYLVSRNGGAPHRLDIGLDDSAEPTWSSDGRRLFFLSPDQNGISQLWTVPAGGAKVSGRPRQLTHQGGGPAFDSQDREFVYYMKGRSEAELWRVPLAGGDEAKVLGAIRWGNFAATNQGAYVIGAAAGPDVYPLQFFSFKSGALKTLLDIRGSVQVGITVSPDGHELLYTQRDGRSGDLVLVENFR